MPHQASTPRTIFWEAIEHHAAAQWPEFLDSACCGDRLLRRQVERLLSAHARVDGFMDQPAAPAPTVDLPDSDPVGTTIGRYKLLEQIGEGGMGVVYVAEQTEPVRRKVALKLIKPGMDSRQVIARFEAERQALALMDHPNIAKVHDGGMTDEGQPYFVMELVRGIPITEYCDQAQATPRKRLELLVTACQAVQHAHHKGIIHRDLKPSNVLVTLHDGAPVPKVIDFGVAKATGGQLTDRTIYTQFSQMIGTPLYMSPEQAELSGLDVDTRSDVYSLGVLLYELLTGQTPFDGQTLKNAGFDEMRRMIRENEPPRPSQLISTLGAQALSTVSRQRGLDERRLRQSLRGELDWIVMKALEKDRTRRYDSASALAADVQRHLADEPVQACPPSATYRLQKLARRHKSALAASILVSASLLAATVVSAWYAVEARAARVIADERQQQSDADFRRALAAVDTMLSQVAARKHRLSMTPEFERVRKQLIDDALAFYEDLLRERPNDPTVRFQQAVAHLRAGEVYGLIDLWGTAKKHQDRARELLAQLHEEDPGNLDVRENLALTVDYLDSATRIAVYEKLLGDVTDPAKLAEYRRHLSGCYTTLATQVAGRDPALARMHLEKALSLCDESFESLHWRSWCHITWGDIARAAGNAAEAESQWRKAIETDRASNAQLPDFDHRKRLTETCQKLGTLLMEAGRRQEAEAILRESLAKRIELTLDYPSTDVANYALESYARSLAQCLQPENPEQKLSELLDELIEQYPQVTMFHCARAMQFVRQGDKDAALAVFPKETERHPQAYFFHRFRGNVYVALGMDEAALQDFNRAFEVDSENVYTLRDRGELHVHRREYELAIADFTGAIAARPDDWHLIKRRGWAHIAAGDYHRGLHDLRRAAMLRPDDLSILYWQLSSSAVNSPGESFHKGFLELADEVVRLNQESANSRLVRALVLLRFGQLDRARKEISAAYAAADENGYRIMAALSVLRYLDPADYRQICSSSLAGLTDSKTDEGIDTALLTCVLAPGALDDFGPAIELARRSFEKDPGDAECQYILGTLLYRAGQFEEARERLHAAALGAARAKMSVAYAAYFLAMTHHKLGHAEDAREWLERANGQVEIAQASARQLALELFRKEASELVNSRPVSQ